MSVKCDDPIDCIINHWQTLNTCIALCKRDGITDRETYGQTDKRIDGRTADRYMPQWTSHYIGVRNTATATIRGRPFDSEGGGGAGTFWK